MKYDGRREARQWFVDTYRGVCNVTLPTFTSDLRRLNEAAIAFDVRRSIELGFEGTLVVSEAGTTPQEYKQFLHCVIDAASDDLSVVVQASFDTLEDACDVLREAERAGADAFLVGFPPTFVAQSSADVLKYHQALCSATELACILFASPTFDFAHLHPSGFPLDILDDLLAIDTVAALKYEPVGAVAPALLEVHRRLNNAIPVICPFDSEAPALVTLTGQRWLGTSVYQYVGDRIPTMWRLLQQGAFDEAMQIYWAIAPARQAKAADKRRWEGANTLHRYVWKYYSWLVGYNGGPIRSPVMRLSRKQMQTARAALAASGLQPTELPDEAFFSGRVAEVNP